MKQDIDQHKRILIVDVRPTKQYVADHIPTAVSIPLSVIESGYSKFPHDESLILYCACPNYEAVQAASILSHRGFNNLKVLQQGYGGWEYYHYPIAV